MKCTPLMDEIYHALIKLKFYLNAYLRDSSLFSYNSSFFLFPPTCTQSFVYFSRCARSSLESAGTAHGSWVRTGPYVATVTDNFIVRGPRTQDKQEP